MARQNKSSKAKAASTGTSNMSTENQQEQVNEETPANPEVIAIDAGVSDETIIGADTPNEQGAEESSQEEQAPADEAKQEESSDAAGDTEQSSNEEQQETPAPVEPVVVEEQAAPAPVEPVVEDASAETEAALDPQPEVTPVAEETDPVEEVVEVPATEPVEEDNSPQWLKVQKGRLADYVQAMGGALLISEKEQLLQQTIFRNVVTNLLKLRGQDFFIALDNILEVINANSEYVFHDKYVFRQYPNLLVSAAERNILINVVTLLTSIANPATRALVQNQLDLGSALKGLRDYESVHGLFHEYINR